MNRRSNFLGVKGDTITEDKAISFPFVSAVALGHSMIFENTLLACEMPFAPKNAMNGSKYTSDSAPE